LTQSGLLKQLTCLQPANRKKSSRPDYIAKLCDALPLSIRSDHLKDEWKLMVIQQPEPEVDISDRIEKYWRYFIDLKGSDGGPKYPNVSMVVKASLTLSHGNADVERGFSRSGCILTEDNTAMPLKMLNARLSICDGMLPYDRKPHLVPVTQHLLTLAHHAHASYNAYLEKKKQKESEANQKKAEEEAAAVARIEAEKHLKEEGKKLQSLEESLKKTKTEQHAKEKLTDSLLTEVQDKLKKAVQTGDATDIAVAQTLLETARAKREERQTAQVANEMQKRVDKRKSNLLDHFFKKPKTE